MLADTSTRQSAAACHVIDASAAYLYTDTDTPDQTTTEAAQRADSSLTQPTRKPTDNPPNATKVFFSFHSPPPTPLTYFFLISLPLPSPTSHIRFT